jgi:hypothetical protein
MLSTVHPQVKDNADTGTTSSEFFATLSVTY